MKQPSDPSDDRTVRQRRFARLSGSPRDFAAPAAPRLKHLSKVQSHVDPVS